MKKLINRETTIMGSGNGSRTIRTVIPTPFGELFDLNAGDKLKWSAYIDEDEVIIHLEKCE